MKRESKVIDLAGKKVRIYQRSAVDMFAIEAMKEHVDKWSAFIIHEHNAIIVRDSILAPFWQWYYWPIRLLLKKKWHKRKFLKYPPRDVAAAAYQVLLLEGEENLTLKVMAGLTSPEEKEKFEAQLKAEEDSDKKKVKRTQRKGSRDE